MAASRTWNRSVWPTRTVSPTASAPLFLVASEQRPHQVVAPRVLGAVLVDHEPREHAARGERTLLWREGGNLALKPHERRPARELVDEVVLGARDDGVAADRRAALRHTVTTGAPLTATPTAPSVTTRSSTMSAPSPGRPAPPARPPTSGRPGCSWFSFARNEAAGNEYGSTSRTTRSGSSSGGTPVTTAAPVARERERVEDGDVRSRRERCGPYRGAGAVLDLAAAADHALGDAADQMARLELAQHAGDGCLGVVQVGGGQEEEREIDVAADGVGRLARSLTPGSGRVGRLREPRAGARGRDPPRLDHSLSLRGGPAAAMPARGRLTVRNDTYTGKTGLTRQTRRCSIPGCKGDR